MNFVVFLIVLMGTTNPVEKEETVSDKNARDIFRDSH